MRRGQGSLSTSHRTTRPRPTSSTTCSVWLIPKLVDEAVNRLPAEELEMKGPGRPPVHPPANEAKVLLIKQLVDESN
jgi:hypothetical protein